ncbi:MAG: BamA/TamA family outer membrane protein [Bacteroidales bacterium]|nr:BamA/TamA family outer membrane protein [Bacteroidales bacterium]
MPPRFRSDFCRLLSVFLCGLMLSCAPERFLREDELLLDRVSVKADTTGLPTSQLSGYVRQHPNSRWFSLFKVPLGVYCISGRDSTKRINRFFQRIGEAPVVFDSTQAEGGRLNMQSAVRNLGFLNADVELAKRQRQHKLALEYHIHTHERYLVSEIRRQIDDPVIDSLVEDVMDETMLYVGMPFDINRLEAERSRLTSVLQNSGYQRFNKSFVRFDADTTIGNRQVALTLRIPLYRESVMDSLRVHPRYHIGKISYLTDVERTQLSADTAIDSVFVNGSCFYQSGKGVLNPSFVLAKSELHPGHLYRESDIQSTYNNLSSLSAILGANLSLEPSAQRPDELDAYVHLLTAKKHAVSAELEGTNSAGDLGAAVALGYQNRNVFRRSAMFSLKVRGAFEAIKGLEGYADQNYIEYGVEADLNFPEFRFPFLSRTFRHSIKAQSIASVMYDSQDRPEFHRRVLTGAWRYRWNRSNMKVQHRVDFIDLNYVFMPWISETFRKEYLTDNSSRNAILRYNYENLFIMKMGYNFSYTSVPPSAQGSAYGQNAYSVRIGIESSGNLLYGISNLFNTQYSQALNAYTLFDIAYAEYVKFDFDFAKSFRFDDRNSMALHFAFGVAYPYGNSTVLPYEKRYFSGGANSVRGWSVRGLGPGSFSGSDGRVDFIRQTGDMKLDMSMEWRSHLFWKIDGAVFVDAGNIWTLRSYEEQPGGQFQFETFWKQIAVAYGLGFRLNFGYFILRLDGGMKAVNPSYTTSKEHFPIFHPRFGRDFQLHFAVGLPF